MKNIEILPCIQSMFVLGLGRGFRHQWEDTSKKNIEIFPCIQSMFVLGLGRGFGHQWQNTLKKNIEIFPRIQSMFALGFGRGFGHHIEEKYWNISIYLINVCPSIGSPMTTH